MGSRKKKKKNRRKGNQKGPVAVSNPDRHASAPTDTPASASPTAEGSAPATPTTETAPLSDVDLQPFGEGPRFSVLMAAYNRADLIHVAIESVLVQDFQDYELVIVDDGSTDETPSVVRGYTDPRIRYIQKAENEGRAPTRRRAVAEARGEFVLWMADDDLIAPGILSRYDQVLRENPGVDVVYGNLQLFDHESGRDLDLFEPNDWTGRDAELLGGKLYGSCIPDGGTVTRRQVYARVEGGLYDDEFVRAQDYELWTRIVGKARFMKIPDTVYRYRKHDGGTSWGQFVDLSYESKIIRRHAARHALEDLFPKFDWRNREAAASVSRLHIGRNLRRYEDPYNAARILETCEGAYTETEMTSVLFWAKLGTGDLAGAAEVLARFDANQGRPHADARALRIVLKAAETLRTEATAALAKGDAKAADALAVKFLTEHDLTYDVCRFRAHAYELIGHQETALQHYCKAARLNPLETDAYDRAKALAITLDMVGPKTDIDAMRRRLNARFMTLPTPTVPRREGPLVSVVAHFDGTAAGRTDLTTVLEQDYEPLELVVVGPDPDLSDPRVRHVEDPRTTLGAAYNAGWGAAKGAVVLWLGRGSRFYPGHVGRMVDTLGVEHHVGLSLGHYVEVDEGGVRRSLRGPVTAFDRSQLLAADIYPLAGVALRREAFGETPFDASITHPTWDFLLRFSGEDHPVNSAHLGYTVPLVADPVFDGRPDADYVMGLQEIYRRHQRDALFDVSARAGRVKRLAQLGIGVPHRGRTSVVVLVSDPGAALEAFVAQLRARTWVPFEIILVAHQLDDDTKARLRALEDGAEDLSVCAYRDRLTPAKAINIGIARANGEVIAVLRDDVGLGDGWLGRLQHHLSTEAEMGVVAPSLSTSTANAGLVGEKWGDRRPMGRPHPHCLVLSRDVIDQVGGVDVALGADGYEWDDFIIRARLAGYRPQVTADVVVGGEKQVASTQDVFADRFTHRWGPCPKEDALPIVDAAFDADRHFAPFGSESGFRPDARPVLVEDAGARNLLVFPPWADRPALSAFLELFGNPGSDTAAWLRAPRGEGKAHVELLSGLLAESGTAELDPTLLVVDAPLAPERESGLYLAADAVYVDERWPETRAVIRRAIDCGRPLLRGPDELSRWLAATR